MVAKSDSTPDHYTWTIEVSPAEVDAEAEFTVKCRVTFPPGRDRSGLTVSIRDHDDAELAIAELTQLDGDVYATDEILLKAPLTEGEHICRAVLIAQEEDSTSYDEISAEFSFVVKAHAVRLNVWGLPTAIAAGERFTLKAGIKCSAGCKLTGRELSIFDGEGIQIGTGNLLDEVWPGTSALYFAEVEAKAPLTVGNHKWEIRIPALGSGIPHAAGAHDFTVNVVDPPDCEITVEALDAAEQAPIGGARVVMHPYRALTGENGVAKVKVVKGTYNLLVSGSKYMATARTVEVTENITVKVELTLQPPDDSNSYYA